MRSCCHSLLLVVLLLSFATMSGPIHAADAKKPVLLGVVTRDSLQQEPYAEWFDKNYGDYTPNPGIVAQLEETIGDQQIRVFFGSWCDDSKREVPHLLKVLDTISFPAKNLSLIAVSNADSMKRQSPNGEELGQEIFRVPVVLEGEG